MRCCRPLRRRREVLTLILAGLVLASAPAHAAVRSRTIVVAGERVTLGDLSPTAPRELLGLDVGPAPRPGKSGFVSRTAVQDALLPIGLPLVANGESDIPIDFVIGFDDVPRLAQVLGRALTGSQLGYRLDGRVGVDAGPLGRPTFGPMTLMQGDVRVRR